MFELCHGEKTKDEIQHICAQPIITDVANIVGDSLRTFDCESSIMQQFYHVFWLHKRLVERKFHIGIKIKRPADLSFNERLGGFLCCKATTIIRVVQGFREGFFGKDYF